MGPLGAAIKLDDVFAKVPPDSDDPPHQGMGVNVPWRFRLERGGR